MTSQKREPSAEKHIWRKFNFTEWRADPRLKMVSRAARSFWLDLCGLIYEGEDWGRLSVDGRPYTEAELGALLGDDIRVVRRLLSELETAGVFTRTEDGFIQSRRILREEVRRTSARSFGHLGGNPALKTSDKANHTLNPQSQSQNPEIALARERILQVIGPGMVPVTPPMIEKLDTHLLGWLQLFDLDTVILPVIEQATAKVRDDPVSSFGWFKHKLGAHHRKVATGLPFGPVPKTATSRKTKPPEITLPEGMAGVAATDVLERRGAQWFASWMSRCEWNGTDVYAPDEFMRGRIDQDAGAILAEHGYKVVLHPNIRGRA